MSWESWVFLLQYWDFLHLKSNFPHLKSNFPWTKSVLPKLAFNFLWRLSAFFNGFLTFSNGFPLSPMAFQISPMAFQFSSTAFGFPRNPRKSIYGKNERLLFEFRIFATCSPSFVITDKQYLHDYPTKPGTGVEDTDMATMPSWRWRWRGNATAIGLVSGPTRPSKVARQWVYLRQPT